MNSQSLSRVHSSRLNSSQYITLFASYQFHNTLGYLLVVFGLVFRRTVLYYAVTICRSLYAHKPFKNIKGIDHNMGAKRWLGREHRLLKPGRLKTTEIIGESRYKCIRKNIVLCCLFTCMLTLTPYQSVNQSINQSINQSVNQSIN